MTSSGNPRGSDQRTQGGGPRPTRFPRWAMAIIGAVTVLALAILIFSLVLGMRAGQKQMDLRRQQEIAIALQRALDLRAEGLVQESIDEYRRVLNLDPGNAAAGEGLGSLLAVAGGALPSASGAATATVAAGVTAAADTRTDSSALLRPQAVLSSGGASSPLAPVAAATLAGAFAAATPVGGVSAASAAPLPAASVTETLAQAQTASRAGRWQEAVALLEPLAAQAAANPTIASMLFDGYVNLALERDNEDQLEAALGYYDKALSIRPTVADVQTERTLIANYLDVQTAWNVEWPRVVALLTQMYATDPQYRDVKVRLGEALPAYGDSLAVAGDWCGAATQYQSATAIGSPDSALLAKLAQATTSCQNGGTPVASAIVDPAAATTLAQAAPGDTGSVRPPNGAAPTIGRILYSARDGVDGRTRVFAQPAAGGAATVVIEDGAQPSLRADGQRYVYRNLRSDLGGISAIDPATGVFFRITDYAEDNLPSWDPGSARVVFASNREGDRRWRIYAVWAEAGGEVTTLSYGETPAWSPAADLIVHRGCDQTGNGCGLWLMDGAGENRRPITNVPGDNRPAWSPDGRSIVFMSDGRDGNMEVYRLDLPENGAAGVVTRLTDDPGIDAAPVVSPDNQWIAFLSNRDGAWKIYAMPAAGGPAVVIGAPKGDTGDWHNQSMLWVR